MSSELGSCWRKMERRMLKAVYASGFASHNELVSSSSFSLLVWLSSAERTASRAARSTSAFGCSSACLRARCSAVSFGRACIRGSGVLRSALELRPGVSRHPGKIVLWGASISYSYALFPHMCMQLKGAETPAFCCILLAASGSCERTFTTIAIALNTPHSALFKKQQSLTGS
jgi:hypothetical protein